jgi:hypothetical protein
MRCWCCLPLCCALVVCACVVVVLLCTSMLSISMLSIVYKQLVLLLCCCVLVCLWCVLPGLVLRRGRLCLYGVAEPPDLQARWLHHDLLKDHLVRWSPATWLDPRVL